MDDDNDVFYGTLLGDEVEISTDCSPSSDASSNNINSNVTCAVNYTSRIKRSEIVIEQGCHNDDGSKRQKTGLIVINDPSDRKEVRRAKNTESARRSRARKNEKIAQLEQMVEQLQARNEELELENSMLKQFNSI